METLNASIREKQPSCCQKCIRVSMIILLVFCIIQIVLGVMKIVYADYGKNKLLLVMIEAIVQSQQIDKQQAVDGLKAIGPLLAVFTFLGVICGCCTLCSAKFLPNFAGGLIPKLCTGCGFIVFFFFGLFWFGTGTVILLPQLIAEEVDKNCDWAKNE